MDDSAVAATHLQDLRAHLGNLERAGKLVRVTRPINKDTELMPLVRWQFRGLEESERKGFLFEHVVDVKGRRFPGQVAVGIYAGSSEIYSIGMGCPVGEIRKRWQGALAKPVPPRIVERGAVQEEVHVGASLLEHGGLDEFPVPISTPGFDVAPYTTASCWVTKEPDGSWLNVGNYRGQIKSQDRIGVFIAPRKHAWKHWDTMREQGQPWIEAALVIGGPPGLTYLSGSRVPYGVEEYAAAGALIGEPLELVRCKTVDLLVPAHAELVIEGRISTEYLEPEAPFGEFTGYMGERVFNAVFETTAITHRKNPIFAAILSQMPPSESSKLKKLSQDNNYLFYLRNHCGIPQVQDITFHEIALESWVVVQLKRCNPSVVWQALYAIAGKNTSAGKIVIAVDDDIDPNDLESVVWALSYRMQPHRDMKVIGNRAIGLDPSGLAPREDLRNMTAQTEFGSLVLINAMRDWDYPPVSLPAKPYMDRARQIWEELGLPKLTPRMPWHGYELGAWTDRDRQEAQWAVEGDHYRTGDRSNQQRRKVEDGE
jgi:4-hydroxy-3-polyprenylbenzoate decarboxylase